MGTEGDQSGRYGSPMCYRSGRTLSVLERMAKEVIVKVVELWVVASGDEK